MTAKDVYCEELDSHDLTVEGLAGVLDLVKFGRTWLRYGFNVRLLPSLARNPWGIDGTPKPS